MNTNDNTADKLKSILSDTRTWIAGALIITIIIGMAIIGTHREPAEQNQKSSAFVITDDDAKQIKQLVGNVVIDCGTWGLNTAKVNKDNADSFKDAAYKYAMGTEALSNEQFDYATSRQDRRKTCVYDYVSDKSPLQSETPSTTQLDAMMTYTVLSNDVDVSNPKDAQLYINGNSRPSLTVTASWTSEENGLYQKITSTEVKKPDGGADVSMTPAGWDSMSKEHVFKDIDFNVEKQDDGKWRLASIKGQKWDTDGYVNVLADKVTKDEGADRLISPTDENNQEVNGKNLAEEDAKSQSGSDEPTISNDNAGDDCIDETTGQYACDANGNKIN